VEVFLPQNPWSVKRIWMCLLVDKGLSLVLAYLRKRKKRRTEMKDFLIDKSFGCKK
jgi:hypothetical protein